MDRSYIKQDPKSFKILFVKSLDMAEHLGKSGRLNTATHGQTDLITAFAAYEDVRLTIDSDYIKSYRLQLANNHPKIYYYAE